MQQKVTAKIGGNEISIETGKSPSSPMAQLSLRAATPLCLLARFRR